MTTIPLVILVSQAVLDPVPTQVPMHFTSKTKNKPRNKVRLKLQKPPNKKSRI